MLLEEEKKVEQVSNRLSWTPESVYVNCLKTPQLEKRKQEGYEWKALKKIDYQRLETVLEEAQSSGEATSSKNSIESGKSSVESEQSPWDVGNGRTKKPLFYNLMLITEYPELSSGEEEEEQEKQRAVKCQQNGQRCDKLESSDVQSESGEVLSEEINGKFSQDKRVIFNGMMEILPIFSNDKFVCSRDTISVDELENLEKTLPASGKFIINSKASRDSRTIDIKPFHSGNSGKKGFRDRLMERFGSFKETVGGKLHCKQSVFTETKAQQFSPFINFLLLLTPFAEDRKKFLKERELAEGGVGYKRSISEKAHILQNEGVVQYYRV